VKAGSGVEFELDWMERFMKMNPSLTVCDASSGGRTHTRALSCCKNNDVKFRHETQYA